MLSFEFDIVRFQQDGDCLPTDDIRAMLPKYFFLKQNIVHVKLSIQIRYVLYNNVPNTLTNVNNRILRLY